MYRRPALCGQGRNTSLTPRQKLRCFFRAAAYTNLIPVFAMFFGMLLLDERLSPGQYGGAVCIVAGVLCSQWRGGAKEAT